MRRCLRIMLFILSVFCFSGCNPQPSSYPFPNQSVAIESIELMHNQNEFGEGIDESNMIIIRELADNEINAFMSEIYDLPTERTGTPPPWGYGTYIARITYINGDIEILGSLNIEYITEGSNATGVGSFYFPDECFVTVFSKYANLSE